MAIHRLKTIVPYGYVSKRDLDSHNAVLSHETNVKTAHPHQSRWNNNLQPMTPWCSFHRNHPGVVRLLVILQPRIKVFSSIWVRISTEGPLVDTKTSVGMYVHHFRLVQYHSFCRCKRAGDAANSLLQSLDSDSSRGKGQAKLRSVQGPSCIFTDPWGGSPEFPVAKRLVENH